MRRRPYEGAADLELLQAFTAVSSAAAGGCGYVHPGDIPHRLYNGNKHFDPAEVMTVWEDGDGVAAWVLVGPRHRSYDAQVRHDLRGGAFEREVLEYADARTAELMRRHGVASAVMAGDAFRCDTARIEIITDLGWAPDGDPPYVINRARISDVPGPEIPDGYTIRAVTGVEEAGAVAAVHGAAFPGAGWTEALYRRVMESPGYDPARELVAVAPGGGFGAFAVTWYDPINRTGLLEAVGTHPDHRRRGLGRAVVQYAAHHMAAAGMEYAIVANFESNAASGALYRSAGFEPWHVLDGYEKPIS
ncbi:MAG: GNAT family N-acetyltransferase [Actinobacteria bacterium]|nr:GNAT family N-acetyltransferase [Actinomycetota bacterium]